MKLKITNILNCIIILSGSLFLAGCRDDLIYPDDADGWSESADGGIVFAVGSTRGFEGSHYSSLSQSEEEIVINPDNFHVVLFSSEGMVKQIWANQELTEITEFDPDMGVDIKKYYVKIPRQDIDAEVVEYIRSHTFKIAVFANWDGYPDFTTTRGADESNGVNRNDIYFISHARRDDSYASGGAEGELDDSKVFGFITGKGAKMGIAQEWVCDRFKSDDEADAAIRSRYRLNDDGTGEFLSNTKPVLTNSDGAGTVFKAMDDYTYSDMWQIWNFGGKDNLRFSDQNYYNTPNTSLQNKWAAINEDLYNEVFDNGNAKTLSGTTEIRGLSLVSADNSSITSAPGYVYGHSVVLKSSNRTSQEDQTIKIEDGSYLQLKIPADGYLRVKCRRNNALGRGTLVARRGQLNSTSNNAVLATNLGSDMQTVTYDYTSAGNQIVRVTGEPVDVVLYAINGDVNIYEIDYIKSRTLQTVDRQMINPASTPEGGISMYGVQDFEPLPTTVWPDGTTFNLSRYVDTHTGSNARNYLYRTISLLRSVAKVEVLVPTSIFPEPSHMYMRTINRFSRSAPIDVFTPTNIIWDGWNSSNPDKYSSYSPKDAKNNTHYYSQALGVDDEASELRTKGFTYERNSTSTQDYKNAVAWLFGIWKTEYGWNWNGENISITKPGPYPRVFNTRISRSDFAHMIKGGIVTVDGRQYYYYYAYLPEKNVTDPNDKGTLSESPKVMRIEMRFGDRNSDANLDDNASYRIYFTPGGKGNGIGSRDDYDDRMEKGDDNQNLQNLQNIYPVMRNHIYRFKITGLEMNELKVEFEVKGPDSRDVDYTFQ